MDPADFEENIPRHKTTISLGLTASMGVFKAAPVSRKKVQGASVLERMSLDIDRRQRRKQLLTQASPPQRVLGSTGVFNRLIDDCNRRQEKQFAIQEYKQQAEEELVSFPSPQRGSVATFDRLYQDARTRQLGTNNRRREVWSPIEPAERTITREEEGHMLSRLSRPRQAEHLKRELLRKDKEDQAVQKLQAIRDQKHPKRNPDAQVMLRVQSPKPQPAEESPTKQVNARRLGQHLQVTPGLIAPMSLQSTPSMIDCASARIDELNRLNKA